MDRIPHPMPNILADINGFLSPQISPAAVAEVRKGMFDEITLHPGHYEVKMVPFISAKSRNAIGQGYFDVDLDVHTWKPRDRGLEIEREEPESAGCLAISETMRHPIWDTPDECKAHFLCLMTKECI